MKIVVISDTHGEHRSLGRLSGDVLVHCGDFALGERDQEAALADLDAWFGAQAFSHVLCVGGNHDFLVEARQARGQRAFQHAVCLEDQAVEIDGIRFHGAPWVPELTQWAHYRNSPGLVAAWSRIPDDVDVLVTHTPPHGILDRNSRGRECGCALLRARVLAVAPQVHCFGHIHASAGTQRHGDTLFVNGSLVDSGYRLSRAPIEVHVARGRRHHSG